MFGSWIGSAHNAWLGSELSAISCRNSSLARNVKQDSNTLDQTAQTSYFVKHIPEIYQSWILPPFLLKFIDSYETACCDIPDDWCWFSHANGPFTESCSGERQSLSFVSLHQGCIDAGKLVIVGHMGELPSMIPLTIVVTYLAMVIAISHSQSHSLPYWECMYVVCVS